MPTYGEGKKRNMSRSVLPSTSRKRSRLDKRRVHHEVRAKVRDLIENEDWDNTDLLVNPQRHKPYNGIKTVVRERRDADKLGPIMRWAEAIAPEIGDTPAERWVALRSMLPPGVIGWHAMTHIENIEEYEREPAWWRRYVRPTEPAKIELIREAISVAKRVGGMASLSIMLRRKIAETGPHTEKYWSLETRKTEERTFYCDRCHTVPSLHTDDPVEELADYVYPRYDRTGLSVRPHYEVMSVIEDFIAYWR